MNINAIVQSEGDRQQKSKARRFANNLLFKSIFDHACATNKSAPRQSHSDAPQNK